MPKALNVLILGSGGREHALVWKAAQSPRLKKLYCAPGSPAIEELAECAPLDILDGKAVAAFCRKKKVDLVIIGPEAPLAAGVADELRKAKLRVVGPGKDAARLESSKAFAKRFMARHKLPTSQHEVFTEAWRARSAVEAMRLPLVIKADGLAAGKGVRICRNTNEALGTVTEFMEMKVLGPAAETIVVERFLEGPEVTVMALVDGKTYKLLPASRDHKRLKDNDEGPNTGGMGAYAPVALDERNWEVIKRDVMDRTVAGLAADGLDYRGLLYAGLILTPEGPKLLEFNCRFGDPETQAVLPLLKSDLLDLAQACVDQKLDKTEVQTLPGACVCVTLACEGYPAHPVTGVPIEGLETAPKDAVVFHAGTIRKEGRWLTSGGRVLGVTAVGADIAQARDKAYAAVSRIRFDGMQYRKDIAAKELAHA